MIQSALLLVPVAGPYLAAAWTALASPAGRKIVFCAALVAGSFIGGWHIKAKIDDAATARAVITKQSIDLSAARDTADQANVVADKLSKSEAKNQEIIRDLQLKLSQKPSSGACTLDDTTAGSLRKLR